MELLVHQTVALLLTLEFGLRAHESLLVAGGIEPKLLDGAGERLPLVGQIQTGGRHLLARFLFGRFGFALIPKGHADVDAGASGEIRSHLFAEAVVVGRVVRIAHVGAHGDGGVEASLGDVVGQFSLLHTELRTAYFGSCGQGFCIDLLSRRNIRHRGIVCRHGALHVELFVEVQLQQALELTAIVGRLRLGGDDVVFGGGLLGLQLHDVGSRHLSLNHHLLSAFPLAAGRFGQTFVHRLGFLREEYLHVELSDLLLDGFLRSLSGLLGDFVGDALVAHVEIVDAAVPHGPVHGEIVAAVTGDFVTADRHLTVYRTRGDVVLKRAIGDILRRGEGE